jgi:hypothetical protein
MIERLLKTNLTKYGNDCLEKGELIWACSAFMLARNKTKLIECGEAFAKEGSLEWANKAFREASLLGSKS